MTSKLRCSPSKHTALVGIDYFMILCSIICLAITLYGIFKFIRMYIAYPEERPLRSLFIAGLLFFIISTLTLLNALLYDLFFLFCPIVDAWEGPLYHAAYFCQVYTLWLVLFIRLKNVFVGSVYALSRGTVIAYYIAFIIVAVAVVPMYIVFHLEAERFITLPYVTLSIIFSATLLINFVYKLMKLFDEMQLSEAGHLTHSQTGDDLLFVLMVKNTLLAVFSILCTFCVIAVLMSLYIRHRGLYERYSVAEEFVLEFVLLLDIVSNFLCILFSYQCFHAEYQRFCRCGHKYVMNLFRRQMIRRTSRSVKEEAGTAGV